MIHELKEFFYASYRAYQQKIKCVLISVIELNGSSYRKPGVRMLLLENGKMIGAVSGGCVEKEIKRQAESVLKTGHSKIMEYDGRLRLGCEGILKILIESFSINYKALEKFQAVLKERVEVEACSYYSEKKPFEYNSHTVFKANNKEILKGNTKLAFQEYSVFKQVLPPEFQLFLFGVEHDAQALSQFAHLSGWKVIIIDTLQGQVDVTDFPGASQLLRLNEDDIPNLKIDKQSAVVIMTHSFIKDLKYLLKLKEKDFGYLGVLGAKKRREKLINHLFEYCPEIENSFIDKIHSPCGLDIGAITPQEISVSIIAEILAVSRNKQPQSLTKNSITYV